MPMTLIYITCKDKEEARKISKALLEKRLIACSNIFPIESMYWWKGGIEQDNEYVILAKTRSCLYSEIKGFVEEIHSYQCPAIVKIDAEANEDYTRWVKGQLK